MALSSDILYLMAERNYQAEGSCLVCGGHGLVFFTRKAGCNLYRCDSCGLIFVWPLPEHYAQIYSADYFAGAAAGHGYVDYEADKAAMEQTWRVFLDEIEKFAPLTGKLLDVGTAMGSFLEIAQERGWQTTGVEISACAAAAGRTKGLNIIAGTLKDIMAEPQFFDVITYWDVWEHLPNHQEELAALQKVLKPGGLLVLNTPDGASWASKILGKHWHLLVPPEHLFIFNPKNLAVFLDQAGLTVLSVKKIGKKFTLQYVLQTLGRWWSQPFLCRLSAGLKNTRFGRMALPINLRDNFFLIAQKR